MSNEIPEQDVNSSINRIRNEFENWLGMVVQQGEKALGAFGLSGQETSFRPNVDIVETDSAVCVCFDVPGIDPDSIALSITGNMLRIQGARGACQKTEESGSQVHLTERKTGIFDRSIPMPTAVLADQIEASAKNGVLSVTLQKPEPEAAQSIKINVNEEKEPEHQADSVPVPSVPVDSE